MADKFAENLMQALSQQVGIPGLALDESGCCVLSFDGVVVHLEGDEQSQRLFLHADVGAAPVDLPESLYRELLEANLLWRGTGGATLSLDGQAQRFMLSHTVPVERTAESDFVDTVGRFVDFAEDFRQRIATGQQQTAEPVEGTSQLRAIPAHKFA